MSLASILSNSEPAMIKGTARPLPLVATDISVRILGGLAIVETARRFRNDAAHSIEATITFPVPLHATLCGLEAEIDGRRLKAKAQRREQARETYEAAIDAGKTGILHEELLRGIHMLSVGHLPAGQEITVTSIWADTLSFQSGQAGLRIPTTVGDIFGTSPLADSDDLVHAPVRHEAVLTVSCDSGTPRLLTSTLTDGKAGLLLDRPIDLAIMDWQPGQALHAVGADGRSIALDISPAPEGEAPLDMAVLLDGSGSMQGGKHEVMIRGLRQVAAEMRPDDRAQLWMFGYQAHFVATTIGGQEFGRAVAGLRNLNEGTCIGPSIATALADFAGRDLLLVTDGKSYDIDVQELARRGVRIGVVLVGEDSLDAQVSYLAALTGGQVFIASGTSADKAIRAAYAALRSRHEVTPPIAGSPVEAKGLRAGMSLAASWSDAAAPILDPTANTAVAALAASLAIPRMTEAEAASLAEAQGMVCHLTSLVLVDEEGATQEGLPEQRKIPLMTPASGGGGPMRSRAAMAGASMPAPMAAAPAAAAAAPVFADMTFARSPAPGAKQKKPGGPGLLARIFGAGSSCDLGSLMGRIDWDAEVARLDRGDLSGLNSKLAGLIQRVSMTPEAESLAQALDLTPLMLCVALLAWAERDRSRSAARIFRAHLGEVDEAKLEQAARSLGLA